jgi:hypothetical protein
VQKLVGADVGGTCQRFIGHDRPHDGPYGWDTGDPARSGMTRGDSMRAQRGCDRCAAPLGGCHVARLRHDATKGQHAWPMQSVGPAVQQRNREEGDAEGVGLACHKRLLAPIRKWWRGHDRCQSLARGGHNWGPPIPAKQPRRGRRGRKQKVREEEEMGRVDGCSRCDSELDGALGVTMANDGGFMGPQRVSSGVCATSGASTTVEAKAHVGGVEHGGSRGGVPARRGRERAGGIERGKRGARRGEKRSGVELLNREVGVVSVPTASWARTEPRWVAERL